MSSQSGLGSRTNNTIIGGAYNYICNSVSYGRAVGNTILGSKNSTISQNETLIIGGSNHKILECSPSYNLSEKSAIIAGDSNSIYGSMRSVILGGCGLKLELADDVVYVPKLRIATASLCNSIDMVPVS